MFDNIAEFKKNFEWVGSITKRNFENAAMTVFRFQAEENNVYKKYLKAIHISPASISKIKDIPFLPISFFKTHRVLCGGYPTSNYFESSGTTSSVNSRHYLPDIQLYETCFRHHFEQFYGKPNDFIFLCLLPSYLERGHSSLVYMAQGLIRLSNHPDSAFYLNEFDKLSATIERIKDSGNKAVLLGVTFALLDFAEQYPMDLSSVIVMETGGMKGRREEWTRRQVHDFLKEKWHLKTVHSEYGMTELFSQAYSKGDGIYRTPEMMQVSVRDKMDPLSNNASGNGCLNVIDLGNLFSCSFVATDDVGTVYDDGSFEVKGRVDYAALRGCSLMAV